MDDKAIPTASDIPTTAPVIPQQKLIRAALNLPADQFQLGDRTFNIHDLEYDDYLLFIGHLTPLIEVLAKKVAEKHGVSIPGMDITPESINPTNILRVCGDILPEMVRIMCKYTDPNITVDEVKKLAKKPLPLALAIIKQVKQNKMMEDFADFFGLTMGMIKSQRLAQ
jgi:hypothetical protein